jgi:hypothetical protein
MKALATLQTGYLEGCCSLVQHQLAYWRHCFDVQARFMQEPHKRRQTVVARGPAWTDHYGRRAHDIDPERDL